MTFEINEVWYTGGAKCLLGFLFPFRLKILRQFIQSKQMQFIVVSSSGI